MPSNILINKRTVTLSKKERIYIAVIVFGIPALLILYMNLLYPGFLGSLLLPNPEVQPMGWFISVIIVLLVLLIYFSLVKIFLLIRRNSNSHSFINRIKVILLSITTLFSIGVTYMLIVVSPRYFRILQSEVGRLFFGG